MTKSKGVYSPHRLLLIRLLKSVFALVLMGVCGYVSFMIAYLSIGQIKPAPDPALLPTVQSLYAHPQPTSESIRLEAQPVEPYSGLCYYTQHQREEIYTVGLGGSRWTEVFLNGERVPPVSLYEVGGSALLALEPLTWRSHCVRGETLKAGLHLMEVRLRRNLWDTPIIYQWAVMVEE